MRATYLCRERFMSCRTSLIHLKKIHFTRNWSNLGVTKIPVSLLLFFKLTKMHKSSILKLLCKNNNSHFNDVGTICQKRFFYLALMKLDVLISPSHTKWFNITTQFDFSCNHLATTVFIIVSDTVMTKNTHKTKTVTNWILLWHKTVVLNAQVKVRLWHLFCDVNTV